MNKISPNEGNGTLARRLRRLARVQQDFDDVVDYLLLAASRDDHGSDRLVAVLAGTLVENAIGHRLWMKMAKDLTDDEVDRLFSVEQNGLFGSLGSRIICGRAFGLFGPVAFADFKKVNLIRNTFAHSVLPIHFDYPEIKETVNSMRSYDVQPWECGPSFRALLETSCTSAKSTFIKSALSMAIMLQTEIHVANQGRFIRKPLP